jgi:hypothetical protein
LVIQGVALLFMFLAHVAPAAESVAATAGSRLGQLVALPSVLS